jgi:hypothetical protein
MPAKTLLINETRATYIVLETYTSDHVGAMLAQLEIVDGWVLCRDTIYVQIAIPAVLNSYSSVSHLVRGSTSHLGRIEHETISLL